MKRRFGIVLIAFAALATGLAIAASSEIATPITYGGIGTALRVEARNTTTGAQAAFIKSFAGGGTAGVHALTTYLTGSGNTSASALNVVSDNTAMSAMQLSGVETNRGTLKISHTGTGSDTSAAALSIDLKGSGTDAQGIFMDATQGGTTGNLVYLRNNGNDILKMIAAGTTGATTTYNGQWTTQKAGTSGTGTVVANKALAVTSPEGASSGDNVAAISATMTGSGNSGASASALKVTSSNASQSAMQLSGVETGLGTLKLTHTATGDTSAQAIQITLAGSGTASRGIFLDTSGGGTTGALLYLRNNSNDILKITPKSGDMTMATTTLAGDLAFATNGHMRSLLSTAITAHAGGGQASAVEVCYAGEHVYVETVASANDSVKFSASLTSSNLGVSCVIKNEGANAMDLFPQSGGTICVAGGACLAANTATSVAVNGEITCRKKSSTVWHCR